MSLKTVSVFEMALLCVAFLSAAAYSALGVTGLWVFGGRTANVRDIVYVGLPLLALPLTFVYMFSRVAGALVMSFYFIITWGFTIINSLPLVALNPLDSFSAYILLVCVLSILFATAIAKKGEKVQNKQT